MSKLECCFTSPDAPTWPLLVVFDLFVLVLFVSFMLVRHFNHRDKGIAIAHRYAAEARAQFMRAAERVAYESVPQMQVAIAALVLLGRQSLDAFAEYRQLVPDAEPDADWLNSLHWVQSKAKMYDVVS